MHWLKEHSRSVIAIGSALVGAVLGAAVQDILNSNMRILAGLAVILGALSVGALSALITIVDTNRTTSAQLLDGDHKIIESGHVRDSVLRDSFEERSRLVVSKIESLSLQLGLTVDRMLLHEVNIVSSIDEDRTAQLIFSAQEELRVLDILSEDGHWPDEAMEQNHSHAFFAGLMEMIKNAPPSFVYHRIVQVQDPAQSLKIASAPGFINHCHDMLDLRQLRGRKVSLRVTRRRFPFQLLLIDRTRLVLQLQEYDSQNSSLRIWGEILVTDPLRALFPIFEEIWEEANDDSATRAVTVNDLPPRPVSAN